MKKIIATVLAMVMALALCTVAFAANPVYTEAYHKDGTKYTGSFEVQTVDAVKYDKTTGLGAVKTYIVPGHSATIHLVEATAADYDLKLTADGRAPLYLSEVIGNGYYACKAVAYTNIGEKCEQFDGDTDAKYYTNSGKCNSSDDVLLFKAAKATDADAFNVLVDGKLVVVTAVANAAGSSKLDDLKTAHDWEKASYNKDNTVATYKCSECGTVATVYKTVDAAKAAGVATVEVNPQLGILGYTMGTTTKPADGTSSPKTFDAGIAMYVGMALTSVAGSAVVIGKKKEF